MNFSQCPALLRLGYMEHILSARILRLRKCCSPILLVKQLSDVGTMH